MDNGFRTPFPRCRRRRRRRRERDGGSPPAPRSPLVGEPGTHPLALPCFVPIGAGVIPPAPALLLRGGVHRCLAWFNTQRRHGPVPHPQRGGDSPRRPREDYAHGPAPAAVRGRYPPRARHGLHQPRARARHHHCLQGHFCFLEGN